MKKFADRLLTLREKFSVTQDEMAAHFNVGRRMYQKYENDKAEPEGITYGKWIKKIEALEKLETLPPLNYEQSPKKLNNIQSENVSSTIDELIKQNNLLQMKVESLEQVVTSLNLLVKMLSDKAGISLDKYKNNQAKIK